MRLLILLPFAPRRDAAHGGGRVITEFLTRITARHEVAVLYLRRSDEPGADDFFRERCVLIEEVVRQARGTSFTHRLLRVLEIAVSFLRLRPLWVSDWSSKAFREKLTAVIQKCQPEIIQAEYHVMGQYLSALQNVPRVLVQYEPGVRAAPFIQNLPSLLHGIIARMEKLSWRRYESWLYRQVNAIVAFTDADHRAILEMAGSTPVHLIAPGTDISERSLNSLGTSPLCLLFFGNYFHPPNVDAARRLIHSIFPAVQKCIPEVRLVLVGDNPPDEFEKMSNESVFITGRVPEVTPYLDQAALFVAPIYQGGGIRIKVMEALAAGKAVVTTPLAAQGLDLVDGEQVSIARNDTEFVERIVHLLEHPVERASMAARARGWACAHLSWDRQIGAYESLWQGLLSHG